MSKKSEFEKNNEETMGGYSCKTEKGEGRKMNTGDGRKNNEEQNIIKDHLGD